MKPFKCSKWNGQPAAYAHLKLDGHFIEVIRDADSVAVWTSNPTDITEKMPERILETFINGLAPGERLFGELYVPGRPASYVKTALKEQAYDLSATFFATPNLDDEASLAEVDRWIRARGLTCPRFLELEEGWEPDSLLEEAHRLGAEGWMLKDGNILNWRKLKAEPTIDLICTAVTEGKGKHLGLIGSLCCNAYAGPRGGLPMPIVAYCGGMTDDERLEMSAQSPIGKVVEVKYQRVDSAGRLRHPVFVRLRDDKEPDDCTVDQDPELAKHYGVKE